MAFNFKYFKQFDFNSVLKFATIDLLKQKKLVLEIIVLFFLLFILFVLVGLAIVSPLIAMYLFSNPQWSLFAIIPLVLTLVFIILTFLIGIYFSYRIISFALESIGKKVQKFSLKLAIKIFLSWIVTFVVSFFSIYELKLFLFAIGGFVLLLVGAGLLLVSTWFGAGLILGVLAIIVACILFFVYYIIITRNFVRTSFASVLLIEKNLGVRESVRSSWNITSGKAVLVFIVQLLFTGIIWVLQQLVLIPLNIVSFPLMLGSVSSSSLMIFVPFLVIFAVLFLVLMIVSELVSVFMQVAIYRQISIKKK
jgi:hypothetical protein